MTDFSFFTTLYFNWHLQTCINTLLDSTFKAYNNINNSVVELNNFELVELTYLPVDNQWVYWLAKSAFNVMCVPCMRSIKVTVGIHKCGSPPCHHHPGQFVHRLNTPSKESQ